ncbi:MAG: hypothetical protein WKF71_02750 [Pyrinomonadaceae bacterium]
MGLDFFFVVVLIALFVDVGIVNRHSHAPTRQETFVWSAVWISMALAFNGFIYWMVSSNYGSDAGIIKSNGIFYRLSGRAFALGG